MSHALARRIRQQEILAELGVTALQGASFDQLLDDTARLTAEGMQAEFCKVLEHNPAENCFLVRAGVGWEPGIIGVATIGADLASPAGFALRPGKPVISNHLENEERFRTPELLVQHGIRRAMNVILQGDGKPFGVLESAGGDRFAPARADDGHVGSPVGLYSTSRLVLQHTYGSHRLIGADVLPADKVWVIFPPSAAEAAPGLGALRPSARPASGARRYRPLVTPLRHQIEGALAAATTPGNEIRERIFPSAIRGGMGLLLRTKRHIATGKKIQVLVAAVNRHMPATPSRCCRRRRARTRSTFPGMYRQFGIYAGRILTAKAS